MNKICGYSCEHNKSGVCQISICDKHSFVTNNTKVFEYTDRYIEKSIDIANKINELQQENQKLKDRDLIIAAELTKLQDENKQLKDNWNKLKDYIKETKLKEFEKSYGKRYGKTFTQAELIVCNMILNKMQELEGSDNQ